MGSLHILHDSAPADQVGPRTYFAGLCKLARTPRQLLHELRNLATRISEYRALSAISEVERMALYARLDNYVGDGSDAFIWRHLWTTREEAALAYVRGGFKQRFRAQREYKRVLFFPSAFD